MNTLIVSPRGGLRKTAVLAAAFTSLLGAASSHAIVNGNFESGTSGWTEAGGSGLFSAPDSLAGFYQSIVPPESGHFGLISNNGVEANSISQTFEITDSYLVFQYRFLTDEYNSGADYNDTATITLTINGVPSTLVTLSRNDLQAGGEGSLLPGAGFIDNTQHGYDIGSGWLAHSIDVSSYIGQNATLTFSLANVNDSTADIGVSHLAVDDVRLSAVPEPSTWTALALAGAVLIVFRRRNRA